MRPPQQGDDSLRLRQHDACRVSVAPTDGGDVSPYIR